MSHRALSRRSVLSAGAAAAALPLARLLEGAARAAGTLLVGHDADELGAVTKNLFKI